MDDVFGTDSSEDDSASKATPSTSFESKKSKHDLSPVKEKKDKTPKADKSKPPSTDKVKTKRSEKEDAVAKTLKRLQQEQARAAAERKSDTGDERNKSAEKMVCIVAYVFG